MSAFSAIFQYVPGDPAGEQVWLLAHYLEHQQFADKLLESTITTTILPIQQVDDRRDWLAAHMRMSQSVWTGIGGNQSVDLERVDWENKGQLQNWFEIHAAWHQNVRDALGL